MAVRRAFRYFLHRDDTRSARLVLDVHRLSELFGEFCCDYASDDFGRTARREGHDKAYRAARPCCLRLQRDEKARGCGGGLRKARRSLTFAM